ncbi:MAG: hypothetical protein HZB13_11475 [Acidobacteria bacterium]|nr:hypothetical protein [Acidobacteriota bacterium]
MTSGIPAAADITAKLHRDAYLTAHPGCDPRALTTEAIRAWVATQPGLQPDADETEFAKAMDTVLMTIGHQRNYLRDLMLRAQVSRGYAHLGLLLKNRVFRTVATTNFDFLVQVGCTPFLDEPIRELAASEWLAASEPHHAERRLLRLHGGFHQPDLRNTRKQLEETPRHRLQAIKGLLRDRGLIVIGYGGLDAKLMREGFHKVWRDPEAAPYGVYWSLMPGEAPSPLVAEFIESAPPRRAFFVEIQGFDEVMDRIASAFGYLLPEEAEYRRRHAQMSEEYAILRNVAAAWPGPTGAAGTIWRSERLELASTGLRLHRAVLLFPSGDGTLSVEAPLLADSPTPPSISCPLLLAHLPAGTPYRLWRSDEAGGVDQLWSLFPGAQTVEAFAVHEEGRLLGCLAVSSMGRSLAESEHARLIEALAPLLVRARQ